MKHIYIFNEGSRAAEYGIGTYIQQMIIILRKFRDVSLNIINLNSSVSEFSHDVIDNYRLYSIPSSSVIQLNSSEKYVENIWFLVNPFIKSLKSDNLIFFINYYQDYQLVLLIKSQYPSSKIYFVVHYQDWCFSLKGDVSYFRQIIYTDKLLLNEKEKEVIKSYENEIKILNEVDKIICLSNFTNNLLRDEYLIPQEKLIVIYNGLQNDGIVLLDNEKSELKKKLLIPLEEKIILFVGRLDEIKGVDILIKAFKRIVESYNYFHLVIIGDGKLSSHLNDGRGIWRKITFTGHLNKDDLYKFYQIADIGVMPSMHEQCSYVAIEMMMFGIPLIISTTTGLNEMIDDKDWKYKFHINNSLKAEIILSNLIVDILKLDKKSYQLLCDVIKLNYDNRYSLTIMEELIKQLI